MPERVPASPKSSPLGTLILSASVFLVSAAGLPAREPRPPETVSSEGRLSLPNDFFAMDTATRDASHQTAREQVTMIKEVGYAGIGVQGFEGLGAMLQELDQARLKLYNIYFLVDIDPGREHRDPLLKEAVQQLRGRDVMLWTAVTSRRFKPSSEGFPDPEKTATIEDRLQNLVWTNDIAIGGGHFVNAGIHAIDAALWIARELPVSAMGCTRTLRANPHGNSPDIDSYTFQFNSGIVLNHCGEHVKNKHQFLCTASACGRDGYIETSYTGNSFVRANEGGYEGGPATNLYNQGIKRNLDTFYEKVAGAVYDNPTVETSVNSTLVTILGREAGARNGLVTWDELLRDSKRVAVDLTGLKE